MTDQITYVHARYAVARQLPQDRGDRRNRLGRDRERAERRPGLPLDVGASQVRHPRIALDGHERVVERRLLLGHAGDAELRPLARPPRGSRQGRHGQRQPAAGGGRDLDGDHGRRASRSAWRTRSARSRPARRRTCCCIKNDQSPAMTPILNPTAHVVYQAGTADVHTVVVDGRVAQVRRQAHRSRPRARARRGGQVGRVRALATGREGRGRRGCTRALEPTERIANPYGYQDG